MNVSISGLSSALSAGSVSGTRRREGGEGDGDGDESSGRVHRGPPGGGLGEDLMQALQSLGVSLPAPPEGAPPEGPPPEGESGSEQGGGQIGSDLREFMHALFDAVKSNAGSESSTSTGSSSSGGSSDFASGLASLVSQVSNGSAPDSLQSAFDQLMKDLSSGSSASGTVSLQQLLGQLQQNVGYGSSSTAAASGNLLSTCA